MGNIDSTAGVSIAFWMKASDYRKSGRLFGNGFADFVPMPIRGKECGVQAVLGPAILTTGSENIFDGVWHHLVMSVDFRAAKDNCHGYVDGKTVEVRTVLFEKSFDDVRSDHCLVLGARGNSGFGMGTSFFGGALDDFAIYDRPLKEREIQTLFEGPDGAQSKLLARTDRPSLKAGANQFIPLPRASVDLKATCSAPGWKVRWNKISGPGAVSFSQPDSLATQATFSPRDTTPAGKYGSYVLRVTASDDAGMEVSDDVSVTLFENNKPPTRKLSAVPPPGVHPRILFSPEDMPEIRTRVKEVRYAAMAMERIRAEEKMLFDPKTQTGRVFQRLLGDDPTLNLEPLMIKNTTNGSFYLPYFNAAFAALVDDDRETGAKLGRAIAAAARRQLVFYRASYGNRLVHDADQFLGLAYDFLAPWMDEADRQPVRQLLARMTAWRQPMGTGEQPWVNSTNWRGHHDHIVIAALAIEGEAGYDPSVFQANVRRLRDFFTQYGVHSSGFGHEAYAYFNFAMEWAGPALVATARRDENFFQTARVYDVFLSGFRQMSPWGDALYTHDDLPQWKSSLPFNFTAYLIPWIFPESKPAQAAARMVIENAIRQDPRKLTFWAALFGVECDPKLTVAESARIAGLPPTAFCPDSGYMSARSGWTEDAIRLDFRCKPDRYALGHVHPDWNSFELQGAGRDWIWDPGKLTPRNDHHTTILVDGIGAGGSINKPVGGIHIVPGRFIDFIDTPAASIGCGDAKVAYDWAQSPAGSEPAVTNHGLTWADFVYKTPREIAMKNEPWRRQPIQEQLYRYNPMRSAFRTVAVVRGAHPYVLVIDDYVKDGGMHQWDWLANTPTGQLVKDSGSNTDLILRWREDQTAGSRLLVRVLNAEGQKGEIALEERVEKNWPTHSLISIKAAAVAPKYRVLLFPHEKGAELPTSSWNPDRTKLKMTWKNQEDDFEFEAGADGRSRMVLRRGGVVVADGSDHASAR